METEYSKRDIAERLGLSVRKVTYWTDFGLVVPDIKPSRGKGKARVYSERNLIEFAMIDVMVDKLKINLDTIQKIFQTLRVGFDPRDVHIRDLAESNEPIPKFSGFLDRGEWGRTKELIYTEWCSPSLFIGSATSFYVVDSKSGMNEIIEWDLEEGRTMAYQNIIFLGEIKIIAMEKLGLKPQKFTHERWKQRWIESQKRDENDDPIPF
jgi:DNA-binding transcriptional MerR regulator